MRHITPIVGAILAIRSGGRREDSRSACPIQRKGKVVGIGGRRSKMSDATQGYRYLAQEHCEGRSEGELGHEGWNVATHRAPPALWAMSLRIPPHPKQGVGSNVRRKEFEK